MNADTKIVIAIDGPAGAGKSTIASRLAKTLGYINLESGAMYRALGLKALEAGVAAEDGAALLALARQCRIELVPRDEGNRVLLDQRDVSARFANATSPTLPRGSPSTPRCGSGWSAGCARWVSEGVIMEGRDIGTVVFPDAEVKIFLDADPGVREERRVTQANAQDDPAHAEKLKRLCASATAGTRPAPSRRSRPPKTRSTSTPAR